VRSLERGRSGARMLLSCSQQRLSLFGTQNADARRPCEELSVRPSVVVAIRAVRVVNGIGKVQGYMPADNEQLARAMLRFTCCYHQNSLYQLHTFRSLG
jgi:hypothetical protein